MNKKVYNGQTTIKTQLTKFVFALAYLALTFVAMTFVDNKGNISNDGTLTNIFRAILASFGIEGLNIVRPTWNVFYIAYVLLVVGLIVYLALPLIFSSAYKKAIDGKFFKKFLIDLVLAVVILAIIAVIFFGVIVGNSDVEIDSENLNMTLKASAAIAFSILLAVFVIAVVFYASIKLYTGVRDVVKYQISSRPIEVENAGVPVFPSLEQSDKKFADYDANAVYPEAPSLDVIAEKFQAYIATVHKIYFDIDFVRSYIAGLATSKIVLLEGLSGTGKSTLPRRFMEFIGGESEFISVQSTWKDRADLIGYYNDFTSNFKETRFLKTLYENTYKKDKMSTIVLDEVNLSRIEYYFADFISAMEFPVDMRYVELMQPIDGRSTPKNVEDGRIHIPENTFFVGTANKDESTYTITERVYDRAIVINFEEKHLPIETESVTEPIKISFAQFEKLVNEAKADDNGRLDSEEKARFEELYNFIKTNFDIQIGDRVFSQLDTFTSVFAACGGNKYRALDIMFANKFVRKINNSFDDGVSENLDKLVSMIDKSFGKEYFVETLEQIAALKKKLY